MFPTAESARILSTGSNSYDALISRAFDAIMNATRSGATEARILYEGVDPNVHSKFHSFMVGQGFRGSQGKYDNHTLYVIRW